MAWTAEVVSQNRDGGIRAVVIAYSDGTQKITKEYRGITAESLSRTAINEIAGFSSAKSDDGKISLGPIDLTMPEAKKPTQDEIISAQIMQKRGDLHSLMEDVRDGILSQNDQRIIDLQDELRS